MYINGIQQAFDMKTIEYMGIKKYLIPNGEYYVGDKGRDLIAVLYYNQNSKNGIDNIVYKFNHEAYESVSHINVYYIFIKINEVNVEIGRIVQYDRYYVIDTSYNGKMGIPHTKNYWYKEQRLAENRVIELFITSHIKARL
jgi:hypothetical protein